MITLVILEGKFGDEWVKKPFEFSKAEKILQAKRVNPSQSWKLPDGSDYTFDGTLKKAVKPKKVKEVED